MTNFSSGVLCRSLQKCLAIYLHFLFISLSLFGSPYHPLAPSVLAALEFASPISGMSLLPAHPPTLVTPIFYAFSIVSARPVCIFHFGTHILLSSKVDRGFGEVSLSLSVPVTLYHSNIHTLAHTPLPHPPATHPRSAKHVSSGTVIL